MINKYPHMLFIMVLILALSACGSDDYELHQYIKRVKSKPARPIEPLPEFAPLPIFEYPTDENRRSPFKPVEKRKEQGGVLAPDQNRPKQPLESFPLDSLQFVGVIEDGAKKWALIKEPSGSVSKIKIGQYMGQNFGRVIRINRNSIEIEETFRAGDKWEKRKVELKLNDGSQEQKRA